MVPSGRRFTVVACELRLRPRSGSLLVPPMPSPPLPLQTVRIVYPRGPAPALPHQARPPRFQQITRDILCSLMHLSQPEAARQLVRQRKRPRGGA
eukprot:764164-Hanusia_phi.AAC.3